MRSLASVGVVSLVLLAGCAGPAPAPPPGSFFLQEGEPPPDVPVETAPADLVTPPPDVERGQVTDGFVAFGIPLSVEFPATIFAGRLRGRALANRDGKDPHVEQEELWVTGGGIGAGSLVHFHAFQSYNQDHSVGFGFLFDTVEYEGDSESYVNLGGTLRVDDLRLTQLLFAFHMRSLFRRFFIAGHAGIGVAVIESVGARFEPDSGGATLRGDLFDHTRTGAFQFGFRMGGSVPLGRSAALGIFLTLAFGSTGRPEDGGLLRRIDRDLEPTGLGPSYLGFGVSFEFGRVRKPVEGS